MIILLLITVGCGQDVSEPKITQTKAEAIILQHLTEDRNKDEIKIKIKSVRNSTGNYIVEWEFDKNCEFGAVQVDDQSGELLEAEETNCWANGNLKKILFN